MAVRQYIGARYVTKIYENSLDPSSAEWEANVTYEPLTMVTYNNSSYLSKMDVPGSVGNPAANPEYWVVTGAYNGQIAALQNDVARLDQKIDNIAVTPEEYGAVGDGVHDDTEALQDAVDAGASVVFKPGKTYTLSNTLVIPDNTVLNLNGSTLQTLGTAPLDMVLIQDAENVIVRNGVIRNVIGGAGTENGHFEVVISSSQHVLIEDISFENNNSDGVYCGYRFYYDGSDRFVTKNVTICNCRFNTGRNGISLVSGDDINIINNIFNMTKSFAPYAGIDVEAESGTSHALHFNNVNIKDNIFNTGILDLYIGDAQTTDNGITATDNVLHDLMKVSTHPNTPVTIAKNLFDNIDDYASIIVKNTATSAPVNIINNVFNKGNLRSTSPSYYGVITVNYDAADASVTTDSVRIEKNIFNECKNSNIFIGNGTYTNFCIDEDETPNRSDQYVKFTGDCEFTTPYIRYKRTIKSSINNLNLDTYNSIMHYNVPSSATIKLNRFAEKQYISCDSFNNNLQLTCPTDYTFDGTHTVATLTALGRPEDIIIVLDYPNKKYSIRTAATVTLS